jgi:hypothetical protein
MGKKLKILCSQVITHIGGVPFGSKIDKCDDCNVPVYIAPVTLKNYKRSELHTLCFDCIQKYKDLTFGGLMPGQKEEIEKILKKKR